MENASKALIMAAGVLLSVMVFGIVVYFFSRLSAIPTSEEEATLIEQVQKFNLEYEIYDKRLMYGVDVISVLNKANSNNEKYVEGVFLSGGKSGEEFYVDVEVKLKTDVVESLIVYRIYTNGAGKTMETPYPYNGKDGPDGHYKIFVDSEASEKKGKLVIPKGASNDTTKFTTTTTLKTVKNQKVLEEGTYYLRDNTKTTLKNLLSFSDNMRQEVKNPDIYGGESWSRALWETALYNFKIKKFKCTSTHYSKTTGRIDNLVFEEI